MGVHPDRAVNSCIRGEDVGAAQGRVRRPGGAQRTQSEDLGRPQRATSFLQSTSSSLRPERKGGPRVG